MAKKATIIRGDGIGPEVVDSMIKVLKECNTQSELILADAGSEQWQKNGEKDPTYIPESTMKILETTDACFKGPTTTIPKPGAPRSVAVTLRQKFELYSNIRPIKTYKRITPNHDLDFVCFREATEGLYTGIEVQLTDDAAIAIRKITRQGCRRFAISAVDWARKHNMKKFVAITKRNILKVTDGIFLDEINTAAKTVPGLEVQELYIDNMMQQLVVNPSQFNGSVLASTNLFMDIVSELASGIIGSIGLVYSSNMGDRYAMFEAAHGSAPSFKGQNKVNPTAAILSGAWMAEYLGEPHIKDAIFSATEQVINEGRTVTFDIGGSASTTQMTDAIISAAKTKLRK
ncbi:isocitrate/isopropylmalate dehydrogenase family protein [Candidatus Nitrosotenuis uzonensis]|uniref:Putative isocitrate/isopropylmalate dehydrogenase n=1 Tax=Candidatus Nitrosotenuis uzonensis TaxID=1407055 RepID=A0A812EZG8_9ARCH|nr:isocitrate/isopropylmalate family dehydrogenase [Candidatus Nitrosotenuis uzonensis]CAE6495801.1 putative isocitrate/isopropylmalate dehydrogenase [Candidatus Nitrosotenuis uzonensis]